MASEKSKSKVSTYIYFYRDTLLFMFNDNRLNKCIFDNLIVQTQKMSINTQIEGIIANNLETPEVLFNIFYFFLDKNLV